MPVRNCSFFHWRISASWMPFHWSFSGKTSCSQNHWATAASISPVGVSALYSSILAGTALPVIDEIEAAVDVHVPGLQGFGSQFQA
jgi:hypothetical protein